MKFDLLHPADQIVMIMDRIYGGGMTTMTGGNISILDNDGNLWITPSGIDKGSLTRADIVKVTPSGEIISKHKPSVELPFHKMVYQIRPDVKAVIHAHPPALVSYSLLRKAPDTKIIPTPHSVCGEVGIATYEIPGSVKLGEKIAEQFKKGYNAVMMDNHGIIVAGEDIYQAFKRFETLEFCARINIKSAVLGKAESLNDEQLAMYDNFSVPRLNEFIPTIHTSEEKDARRMMCELIRRAYKQKLFISTQGTFSQRLADGSFLITPYDVDRQYMEPADLVLITNGWREAGKIPSRSVELHKMIYMSHPDVNAIIIANPTNVMAFGITRTEFDSRTIPESYIAMRDVQRVPFGTSKMYPEKVSKMISSKQPCVLVENECLIVAAKSLIDAFDKLEVSEFTAETLIQSKLLGEAIKITPEEVEEINKAFKLS